MLYKMIRGSVFLLDYIMWLLFSPYKFKAIEKDKVKKVVIINLGYIGDILATTPLIRILANNFESVDIVVRPSMVQLLENNPYVGRVIPFISAKKLESQLMNRNQLAFIIHPHTPEIYKSLEKAGISYFIGHSSNFLRERAGFKQTRKHFPFIKEIHKVEENASLTNLVGIYQKPLGMEIYFNEKDKNKVNLFLKKNKLAKFAVIHPGKRTLAGKNYLWEDSKFGDLVNYIHRKYKIPVLIGGSKEDNLLAKKIMGFVENKNMILNITGKFSLREYGYLISKSFLVLSIDTSAVHFAGAAKKKTVTLFCCYPGTWHPWQSKNNYRLILNREVNKISSSEVKKAIDELI